MRQSEQTDKIDIALSNLWAELGNPPKNRKVNVKSEKGQYQFEYATLDSIYDMLRPLLAKHKIAIAHGMEPGATESVFFVTTRLLHGGQWIEAAVPAKAERPGMQGMGSAITYAKRYGVGLVIPMIADFDDDANAADGNSFGPAAQAQRATPAKAAPKGTDKAVDPRKALAGQIKAWSGVRMEDLGDAYRAVASRMGINSKLNDLTTEQTASMAEYVTKSSATAWADWLASKEVAK